MALVARAPSKINLGLHVLRRRPDGDHDVETVLHRLDWADTITVEPAERLSMTCSDSDLPVDHRNLCMQAAHRLAEAFDVEAGAALHLEKRVPYGSGLGGGSSDAAVTLRLLVELWELEPTPTELFEIARRIGADVPFFLQGYPAAYATGRGDELAPLRSKGDAYRLPYPVVVVPSIEVETAWAYAQVTPDDTNRPDLRRLVRSNDLDQWRSALSNDFEAPVMGAKPEIASVRAMLREQGAAYVSLSGSGGAVYGLFHSAAPAHAAKEALDGAGFQVYFMPGPDETDVPHSQSWEASRRGER